VPDGVLDQGLEKERRQPARARVVVDTLLDGEARAEAHGLDGQVGPGHRQLFFQGHAGLLSEGKRLAEELREQDAHLPGAQGVDGHERADRVQAVEEEVRMDLRAQGAQLRLAGQDRQLHGVLLRTPRRVHARRT
jgi:hypothetical protein